ncbi:MAG: beta-lactamase family protein [Bacteroidales bacterium]|nr:MAG: beta-lactamase family protein [Bacteroidales bacterium]
MKKISLYVFFLMLVMMLYNCKSAIEINTEIKDMNERLNSFLDNKILRNEFPGIQYIVVDRNQIIYSYVGGFSDVINKKPMTFNNTLNTFSTTKLITAIAILQLMEKGKLKLDDKVSVYIKDIPYREITIRNVLSHSSGIPNPVLGRFYIHWEDEHKTFDREELLDKVLSKNSKLKYNPDTKIKYSNLGYAILGKVIEVISGTSYEKYVQQNIFDRFDIDNKLCHFKSQKYSDSAKPYYKANSVIYNIMKLFLKGVKAKKEGKWKTLDKNWYFNFPAHGGIIVSAREYAKLFQDLLKDDSKLLSKTSKELFFSEQIKYKKSRRAIGWSIREFEGIKYYSHTGGGLGYVSAVRYYPEYNIISVLQINRTNIKALNILNQLDKEIIEEIDIKPKSYFSD